MVIGLFQNRAVLVHCLGMGRHRTWQLERNLAKSLDCIKRMKHLSVVNADREIDPAQFCLM